MDLGLIKFGQRVPVKVEIMKGLIGFLEMIGVVAELRELPLIKTFVSRCHVVDEVLDREGKLINRSQTPCRDFTPFSACWSLQIDDGFGAWLRCTPNYGSSGLNGARGAEEACSLKGAENLSVPIIVMLGPGDNFADNIVVDDTPFLTINKANRVQWPILFCPFAEV